MNQAVSSSMAEAKISVEEQRLSVRINLPRIRPMRTDGAVALAGGLKSCTNLRTLNISYNSVGSEGAVALADGGLKSGTNLQTLNISKNGIGSYCASLILTYKHWKSAIIILDHR